ncbi:MAG: copper ion binding protein [Elusimicrobiota bacterium]|jgi:copper chaperone|nr:copper ion binding protein [Elusimicrobiota bacterium]
MEKKTFKVEGMSCNHCVQAVTNAVKELKGVKNISVSLKEKKADIEFEPLATTIDEIKNAIEEQGFEAEVYS